ncbi:MAG: 2-hydroxyacid dehydrogenase [Pyramidobacter sp.]|nr:2-hydroxyacid dehydrogenase [Pyramidobacter sp.]
MSCPKILWFGIFSDKVKSIIRAQAPEGFELMFVQSKTDREEHLRLLAEADYIAPNGIKMTEEYVRAAKKAKLIQLWGAGYDAYDLDLLKELNIALQNGVGFNAPAVAEMVILHILALNRKLLYVDHSLRQGRWLKNEMRDQCASLYGKTVGILGFGNIGRRLCELAYGMKAARVVYYDLYRAPAEVEQALGAEYMPMDDVLRAADIVSLHLPLNDSTRHVINAEKLALMKRDAIIINTARGPIIDQAALVEALKNGTIRGAGLDTFEPEPPAPDNPLFALDNVVLTSHGAGAVFENIPPRVQHVYDCIVKFEKGEPADERFVIVRRAAK